MRIDEGLDWLDDFDTWEEVGACLHDDWLRVGDVRQRLEVERELDALLVVEVDRRLRARQRRDLHRLGFRPTSSGRVTVWQWDAAEAIRLAATPAAPDSREVQDEDAVPALRPRSWEVLRSRMIAEELINRQVLQVVRDVFRSDPHDVAVVVLQEDASWEEWDDDEQWSAG